MKNIVGAAALYFILTASIAGEPPVKFAPTPASLETYSAPEWFRNAKFGIWSHWGPQAVPRAGDWYARNMYIYGTDQYKHHLKNYGHPSKHGYKDIIPLWKAEKFDPVALMALYKHAGARYFVSMGVHHDNFDLWDSSYHRWNAVQMGPHRDIVGAWRDAAKQAGLRFGVSEHLGASYAWFHPSHGFDQIKPQLGVGYDGADPAYADLYHPAHQEPYRGPDSWYAHDAAWQREWFNRVTDLLSKYQPDLLYTDGGIPFGVVGRTLLANFYNQNIAAHQGKLEAVFNHKRLGSGEYLHKAGVESVERGVLPGISPQPWQTDTSIGDWFYSEGFKYKTTSDVVHMLTDIVSKNGNMLLNVVQYPDGSLPPECLTFLSEMAAWMQVNGEAIYDTRPWTTYGEGPTNAAAGAFKEGSQYTAADLRFTTKDDILYAITMGEPSGEVRIASLAKLSARDTRRVKSVMLLGDSTPLTWAQRDDALVITVPSTLPTGIASSFKISFY